ncbi:hypothetical protein F9L00_14155 [Brucella anthropi]|uniref:hypothetical protein n=1 Tax=Brucella TaxID=234 RepID=UPI00110E68A5|nr:MULTISPECIES: hypothetical protein [Brucella]KAB2776474.1 hypothetical protein F9L00_14155 [Brucella anthropi]MBO1023325.1 hypothetical protein [Ochrobactrum sp. SD129]TMV03059.1 hypothetical protein FGI60_11625 [Brucella haematophila]WKT94489.1 hypothetical protein QYR01_24120 [Brucella anthropi]
MFEMKKSNILQSCQDETCGGLEKSARKRKGKKGSGKEIDPKLLSLVSIFAKVDAREDCKNTETNANLKDETPCTTKPPQSGGQRSTPATRQTCRESVQLTIRWHYVESTPARTGFA